MENYFTIKYIENKNKPKLNDNIIYQNNFLEDKYLKIINKNLYEKIEKMLNIKNKKILDNLFIYGNSGVGKYTLSRFIIKKYIDNNLINETTQELYEYNNKELYYFKSRFHYEIIINKYNFTDFGLIVNFLDSILYKDIK